MKRTVAILMLLSLGVALLFSYSIHSPEVHQPFDSVQELSKVDFSRPLAENQRAWIDNTSIYLLTVGPGDPLYSWFGHSALIVNQPSGSRIMYDWGIFDYNQEHFYLNFARGRMYYYVLASEAGWRIEEAIEEQRDVALVELRLPDEAKFALIDFLRMHITPEANTYLYHFYDDNCATRIRDIIDFATGGQFGLWARSVKGLGTYRQLVMRNMIHSPAIFWALDTLQGKSIDRLPSLYDQMFLPQTLHEAVLEFTYPDGTKLAKEVQILQDTTGSKVRHTVPDQLVNPDLWYALFGVLIALLLTLFNTFVPVLRRILLFVILFALAVMGSVLLFMMVFSDMDMTYFNENILFINPLLFFPAFTILLGKRKKSRLLAYECAIMIILLLIKWMVPSLAIQDNLRSIEVLLPIYLTTATVIRGQRICKGKPTDT